MLIDPTKMEGPRPIGKVFVRRFFRPLVSTVVIDDEHPTMCESRVKMIQFVFGRPIEIGVKAKKRNTFRNSARDSVLYFALDELQKIHWIAGRRDIIDYVL